MQSKFKEALIIKVVIEQTGLFTALVDGVNSLYDIPAFLTLSLLECNRHHPQFVGRHEISVLQMLTYMFELS